MAGKLLINLLISMAWNLFAEHTSWLWKALNIGSKIKIYVQFGVHLITVIDAEIELLFLKLVKISQELLTILTTLKKVPLVHHLKLWFLTSFKYKLSILLYNK